MSDTVIRVENLSKKYVLSHQQDGQSRYKSLRESISNGAKSLGNKFFRPASKEVYDSTHEEFWALKDVSFEIKQGDRVGIIGRNGAGKSTLLKILSRITEPTKGKIHLKGQIASLLEVGTGFHPELTGRENIFLNGAILGMGRIDIQRKFDEIVDFAEVEKFLDTPVKRYSSGMYVRLAFAVAAHLEPEILIVDEVLAVGDAQFQKKCLGKMEDVGKEGRTVLFVSHNMATITTLCQRCIWLVNGQVNLDGHTDQVTSKYLTYGAERSGEVVLTNNNRDQKFWFNKVCLINSEEKIASVLNIKEPFKIRLEYYANEYIKGLEVSLKLYNSAGVAIFSTNRSSSILSEIPKGNHISEIEIPALFLVPGTYSVDIGAHLPQIEIIAYHQSLLSFEIEETGSSMALYKDSSYGVVMVNFPWKEFTNSNFL